MISRLGIEPLSVWGINPVDNVHLAAELGCAHISAAVGRAPSQQVSTLDQAVALVAAIDRPNFRVLTDAMHFFRSGGEVEQIAALPHGTIAYAQLCDVPMAPTEPDYLTEAMNIRLPPGQGELPLASFINVLPGDIPIGLEAPDRAKTDAGIPLIDVLRPAVAEAEALLKGN